MSEVVGGRCKAIPAFTSNTHGGREVLGGYYMLFVRTKIFGIRIVYERSGGLRLHAHFSRTKL